MLLNLKTVFLFFLIITKIGFSQQQAQSTTNESPYNFSLKRELPFIGIGIGLFSTGAYFSKTNNTTPFTVLELNALNKNDINKLDRGATYNHSVSAKRTSDYITYSTLVLPLLFLGKENTRKDFLHLMLIAAEVGSITTGITNITKNTVNRPRPYTYNPTFSIQERTDEKSKLSFFSGHVSITSAYSFFFAKVINDYHPKMKKGYKISLWSLAVLLPTATGYFRIKAGRHYTTDVLAGLGVGAITGWLVPHLHKKNNKSKHDYSLLPYNYNGYNGLSFNWKI